MFFIVKTSEETTFDKILQQYMLHIIMETQKITNLLGNADNESLKFATGKWYVIHDQSNTNYGDGYENGTAIKFETKVIKSNLCGYLGTYILVTGDITATGGDADTKFEFKNCAPFTKCVTHINDEHVDDNADNLDIVIPMYNLIEYSDNYSDTSGSLWQFQRDEQNMNNGNPVNVTADGSSSFKYKSSFLGESIAVGGNRVFKNIKIAVPLKYLSNIWRSLEMPMISCKIHLELNWSKDCVMSTTDETSFKITNTKLYVLMVTLSSKDHAKLVKLLEDGFNRPAYYNEYQTKIEARNLDNNNLTRFSLDDSFQGVRGFFVLVLKDTTVHDANNLINSNR